MSTFARTVWILSQAFGLFAFGWFITFPLIFLLVMSMIKIRRSKLQLPRFKYIYLILFSISIVIALAGAIFFDTENEFAHILIVALWVAELVLYAIAIAASKGWRMLAFSLGGLLVMLASGVTAVAGMSIYNDWL